MPKDEKKKLITQQKKKAGTSKKDNFMTADQKITMSQGKTERQKQEKYLPDGRGHNQVPVIKDENATQQLPYEFRGQFYCGTSTADGNCLYHACSLAVWGDESKSNELRTDTADELMNNPGRYCPNHPYIKHIIKKKKSSDDEILAMYLVMFDESVKTIESDKLIKHISNEGKETQKNGRYSSLLHVLALSTVLQTPIQSICPDVELYNGTIQPFHRKGKKVTQNKITLFWAGVPRDGASRVPIHIVPVLSKHKSETTISSDLSVSNTSLHGSTVIQSSTPEHIQNRSSDTSPVTGDSGRRQPLSSDDSSAVNMSPIEQVNRNTYKDSELAPRPAIGLY